jgi:proline utilization trans-activator
MSFHATDLPIHIGEAADAAFATRLRQAASTKTVSHLPRVQYVGDDTLRSLSERPLEWPSASHLRFLVNVALKTVGKSFHIVRRSIILANVQQLCQDHSSCDWLTQCRLWALLAIGEAYSSRSALPNHPFPGTQYWARAMSMMSMPYERPRLQVVEIYLLLVSLREHYPHWTMLTQFKSFYSASINRRHTAISLGSYALRICVILGLHIDITETQLRDQALREHRCRLWWTAYRLDRAWCSRIGWPPSIPDESVEISLPSDDAVPLEVRDDFEDAQYIIFAVKLAKMHNHAVITLYVRKRQPTSFSERVQVAVRALRDWVDGLPSHLRIANEDSNRIAGHILYLHLAYNQAVIVTTRPILLHLLRQRRARHHTQTPSLSESAMSLTTACIHCARQSMNWLKKSWADGTFPTFDYFSMQFLFSAATILALSTLLQSTGWAKDREDFLLACSFLQQLERSGNFGAKEFCTHTDAIQAVLIENLDTGVSSRGTDVSFGNFTPPSAMLDGILPMQSTAYPGAPLQDFLNQANIDLDFMDMGGQWLDWQDVFWPQVELPSNIP